MLRQEQVLKPYRKVKNFEDTPLFSKEDELIPLSHALGWATAVHFVFLIFVPIFVQIAGLDLQFFARPQVKQRDIEFVLVHQPEEEPINKNTPLRADQNSRAGGINDPNRPISPPQPALPKSAPEQQNNDKKQKVTEQSAPAKAVKAQPQPAQKAEPKKAEEPKQVAKAAPKPPCIIISEIAKKTFIIAIHPKSSGINSLASTKLEMKSSK